MADENNRIVNQNSGGLNDLSAIVAAVNTLATNTREVKGLLDAIKSSIGSNTSSTGGVTKADIDKLFKDYVEKGFDALEQKIGSSNGGNSNNRGNITNRTANDVRRDARNTLDSSNRLISEFDTLVRNSNTSFDTFGRSLTQFDRAINESIETERNRARQTGRDINTLETNLNGISDALRNTRNMLSGENNLIDRELGNVRGTIRDYTMQINTHRRAINQLLDSGLSYDDAEIRLHEDHIARLYRQAQDESEIGDAYARMRDDILTQSTSIEDMTTSIINTQRDLRQSTEETLGTSRDSFFGTIASSITNSLGLNDRANEAALRPYDTMLRQYDAALETINRYNNELTRTFNDNARQLGEIAEQQHSINSIPEEDRSAEDRRNLVLLEEQARLLTQAQENIEAERENLAEQQTNLTAERDNIQTRRTQVANSSNVVNNIGKKLISFLGGLVKDAITIEAQHIRQAADEVFDSFERLQQSIGKSLKLSSGAYDDFKEQMIQAAADAGVAVDVTQLNDAAASMAELGIRDTEILKDFAIGANILSESGSNLQLDEDITRQLLASYNKNISSGNMTQQEASDALIETFYDLAAAESAIAERYNSVTALSRGGYQTISQWFNQLQEAGYLQSDQLGEFTLSMGSMMQAMENFGVDSSTLLSDLDSVMQGNFSGLNTELQKWLQESNIDTKEEFLQAISTNFGDVALEFEQSRADLYKGMDAMSVSYARPAFGSNLTDIQALGRVDKIDEITTAYTAATRDTNMLANSVDSIKEGLKNGDWLTATDKLDKYNKQLADRIAAEAQNLPDGKTIMDKGFEVVNSGINMLIDAVGGGFGAVLTAMTTRSLTGAGTTGAGGLGSVGQFMTGARGSTLGTAGRAVGAVAGLGVAGFNVLQNIHEEGSISAGIEASLTDPNVYSGIGMTLGGVIGGPIGSAIGGAIGYASSTIGNKIADVVVPVLAKDEVAEAQQKAAEELELAAVQLRVSAVDHQTVATNLKSDINSQKETFKTYNANQKLQWLQKQQEFLKSSGLIDYQHEITDKDAENNELFEKAIKAWEEAETNKMLQETALGKANMFNESLSDVRENSGLGITAEDIGVAGKSTWVDTQGKLHTDMYESVIEGARTEKRKNFALRALSQYEDYSEIFDKYNVSLEDLQTLAETGEGALLNNLESFAEAYTEVQELMSDTKSVMDNENLTEMISTIEDYAKASNIKDFEIAATEYLQATGSFDEAQAAYEAQLITNAKEKTSHMEDVKKQMQSEWEKALKKSENEDLTAKQLYEKLGFDTSLIPTNSELLSSNTLASNVKNLSDNLLTTYESYDNSQLVYDDKNNITGVKTVTNSHASGLYYVPYDEYPAILHEGEMILDSNDADRYRTMLNSIMDNVSNSDVSTAETYGAINNNMSITNDIDMSPIKESVDNQTNSVTDILNKILNLLMGLATNTPSHLPRSLVQMDSNLNRL